MGLSNITNNIPNKPDPSALSQQLPGGLGDSASRANDLVNQMQGMSCPDFNPGMPGAAKAQALSDELNNIGTSVHSIKNPMANELDSTQQALDKLRKSPTPENMQNYQANAKALQDKAQQTYGDSQAAYQKKADFAGNAQAEANSESDVAKKRAMTSVADSAEKYRQAADDKSSSMLQQVNSSSVDGYKNDAQQAMYNVAQNHVPGAAISEEQTAQKLASDTAAQLQQKYSDQQNLIQQTQDAITSSGAAQDYVATAQKAQAAQDAASQMQNQLPQPPSVDPNQLPPNPYANLNNTVQSWSLPQCPQLSNLQSQLSGVQDEVSNMLSYNPAAAAMQQLNDMKGQMSGLSDQMREKAETAISEVETTIEGNDAAEEQSTQPGTIAVNGAKVTCSMTFPPNVPFDLKVLPEGSEANGQPMAQPLTAKFNCSLLCSSMGNPETAAKTAAGAPIGQSPPATYGTCKAATPGIILPAWSPTSKNTKLADGQPVLVKGDKTPCAFGGQLTILDPGQDDAVVKI